MKHKLSFFTGVIIGSILLVGIIGADRKTSAINSTATQVNQTSAINHTVTPVNQTNHSVQNNVETDEIVRLARKAVAGDDVCRPVDITYKINTVIVGLSLSTSHRDYTFLKQKAKQFLITHPEQVNKLVAGFRTQAGCQD